MTGLSAGSRRSLATGAFAALVLGCLVLAPPASSQEDVAPQAFGETLDVVVVEVEAVVTDADGRRVTGLGRDDFRVLVDGEEVAIDHFAEVRDGRAVTVSAPPPAGAPAAAPEEGAPVATNYLVFIDEYFSIGARRDFVVRRVAERVRDLPPQDRMAVVAFDGERIVPLAGWDASREELQAALMAALERPAHGIVRSVEWVRRGQAGPWNDRIAQLHELQRVLTALRSTLTLTPRPEGRKVLLLLGGAWSVSDTFVRFPETGLARAALPTGYDARGPIDDRTLIAPVIDQANLLGYTVYPVDVNGLRAPGELAEEGDTPFAREIFRHGVLRRLGEETGGRALLFADRGRPLEAAVEDTRSYYSFGITPELERDGASHAIRVEVRGSAGRGLEVRARRGYKDVSVGAELDLLVESTLRFGPQFGEGEPPPRTAAAEVPDDSRLSVELGEPSRRPRRTMVVPLALGLPWSELTLLPSGDGLVSRIEIRVAARDRDGALSQVATVPLQLRRDEAPEAEAALRWESDLTLRHERHDLVVSVYDALSGRVLTRRVAVDP